MEEDQSKINDNTGLGSVETEKILSRKNDAPKSRFFLPIAALVMIAMVVVLVVVLTHKNDYDEGYFVSDDSKLVVAMDKEIASYEEGEYEPDITYVLYYYSGDNITGMKVFFAYDDEGQATTASDHISLASKGWATSKNIDGKYLVFNVASDQFEGLTVSYVKKMIENMKEAGTMYEPDEEKQDEIIDIVEENAPLEVEIVEVTE